MSAAPGELRRRQGPQASVADGATDDASPSDDTAPKATKTYGHTPNGTTFLVPETHDMVSQLLDPRAPKNVSDLIILGVLAVHIAAFLLLPSGFRRIFFASVFLFWRMSYNLGLGLLLRSQSNENKLVAWAQKLKLFVNPATGDNPRPWLYRFIKRDLEIQIPNDYKLDEAPIEYNTWLIFRRLVDVILMCDFVSYCLCALSYANAPEGEHIGSWVFRWIFGPLAVLFNLRVKLDAHRVVKDFAWYWGDFFFLVDQDLVFDGVFQLAPHPMYSIGYIGFYGISAMAGSWSMAYISVLAHAAQLTFLVLVENPHIEKIYNPPPPRKSSQTQLNSSYESHGPPVLSETEPQDEIHGMLGLRNIDMFRNTDWFTALVLFYVVAITASTPSHGLAKFLFVLHATLWRLWFSLGLGTILACQSENKSWTRHFVKFGDSPNEAWRQWKSLYLVSQVACNASFVAACWKMYSFPADWDDGYAILRHFVGSFLIALHLWAASSVYESLGEFGWFYGDFFFDQRRGKLNYTSIYRFLNNPERVIGTAGVWGATLITWKASIFLLALVTHALTIGFLHYVERPHMRKVYGETIRNEAGVTKFIKDSLPDPVKGWSESVNKVVDGTSHFVEELLDAAKPKFAGGVSTIVRDTSALFNLYPARLTLTRLSPDLAGRNPKHYSIKVEGETSTHYSALTDRASSREGTDARFPGHLKTTILEYGAPIRVKWTAPANHGKKDWIGLFMVADNHSRDVSELTSLGRWVPTTPQQYESTMADRGIIKSDLPVPEDENDTEVNLVHGEMEFSGDKLWWTQGTFEFRYHHDGGYNVMSISQPFELHIGRFDEENSIETAGDGSLNAYQQAIEAALLPVVTKCLDGDPNIAPNLPEEPYGKIVERDGKYAKRVVYAVQQMFGVEFAPAVVPADGNVRNLAWRVCKAKQVLAPYSMSSSKGNVTPVYEKRPESP